jgi:hypothetical protein
MFNSVFRPAIFWELVIFYCHFGSAFLFVCRFYACSFSLYFSKESSHEDLVVISFESGT